MTPEREKEIRELNTASLIFEKEFGEEGCQEVLDVRDLLVEIDRLRAEVQRLHDRYDWQLIVKERDSALESVFYMTEHIKRLTGKLAVAEKALEDECRCQRDGFVTNLECSACVALSQIRREIPEIKHECDICGNPNAKECGFISNDVCTTYVCEKHQHKHGRVE